MVLGSIPEHIDSVLRFLSISFPEFRFKNEGGDITVSPTPAQTQLDEMAEIIKVVMFSERLKANSTIFENDPQFILYSGDVQADLESKGEIKWIKSGLVMYEGPYLSIKKKIEKIWEEIALEKFHAYEIENPGMWSMEIFQKTGYLHDFPHEALFVVGAKKLSTSLASLSEHFNCDFSDNPEHGLLQIADNLQLIGGCQPSVCTSCYFALSSQQQLKNRIYTTYNRVFRNEGARDLSRLTSFTVRDIMAVGDEKYVLEYRNKFLQEAFEFIKKLGLKFKIEASNDPFFSKKLKKISFQNSGALKYEIQAFIPYSNSWLAVGSINYHMTNFGNAFDISISDGISASSCCIGIGFDRLIFALYAQFGPELKDWPIDILGRQL